MENMKNKGLTANNELIEDFDLSEFKYAIVMKNIKEKCTNNIPTYLDHFLEESNFVEDVKERAKMPLTKNAVGLFKERVVGLSKIVLFSLTIALMLELFLSFL